VTFTYLCTENADWRQQPEALIQPIWSSNRAFRADRPIQNFAKFESAIAFEQKFIPAHFQPIEDNS
jgi:hypothetical protein